MNTSPEAVEAAFVTLGWILTGTLTYWLICDADEATCQENSQGDNPQVRQDKKRVPDALAANQRSQVFASSTACNGRDVQRGIQRHRNL